MQCVYKFNGHIELYGRYTLKSEEHIVISSVGLWHKHIYILKHKCLNFL